MYQQQHRLSAGGTVGLLDETQADQLPLVQQALVLAGGGSDGEDMSPQTLERFEKLQARRQKGKKRQASGPALQEEDPPVGTGGC